MNPMTQALAQQHIFDLRKQACLFQFARSVRQIRRPMWTTITRRAR